MKKIYDFFFVILGIFPISGNNGKYIKKIYDIEKKKILVQKVGN